MLRSCMFFFLVLWITGGIPTRASEDRQGAPPYSPEDVFGMARFIAEFVQHLRIYSLCISSTSESAELSKGVLASLSSYLVFTSPCCVFERNSNQTKICSAYDRHTHMYQENLQTPFLPSSSTGTAHLKKKSLPNLAEIHLASKGEMEEATDYVLEKYEMTQGAITMAIVGFDLETYHKKGVNTARWIVASYKENNTASIYEVYSFTDNKDDLWLEMGQWQASRGVSLRHFPGEALRDFQGHTLRTAFFPYAPYIMMGKKCPDSTFLYGTEVFQYDPTCVSGPPKHSTVKELYVGYLIDVMETLAESLNFTYELVLPKNESDYIFGVGEEDGFKGLVGMVVRKEAEIILSSLGYTRSRLKVIDFSTNIDYFERNLYIRQGATLSTVGWGTYAMSFDKWTWLSTVSLLILTSVVFWISMGIERNPPEDTVRFRDILFMFFSCTMQQGTPNVIESYRGRTVVWLYWFSCVVLYAAYTAVLTSYLTVSTESLPFTTLQQAVESFPEWQVGILEGTSLRQLINESKGIYPTLSDRLNKDPSLLVTSDAHGIEKVLTEKFVYFADTPALKYMLQDNCSVSEIHVGLFFSYGHLGLANHLPYVNILDSY
ncbi:glutamate receptor ionotropic, kainate glr-3-like isoform X3 [Palaemon carinicauda]|uniref:glutamate receptor ionotropic, kainate glr-3-like isoform X3 n=1 Tax=Palaemon carinicauda TaxID=392227 RepID=UPI0035B584EB